MHLALGLTDSWAHRNNYKQHLLYLEFADYVLQEIYQQIRPDYLIVTTDHGRGKGPHWTGHGTGKEYVGCESSWCAMFTQTAKLMQTQTVSFQAMRYLSDVHGLLSRVSE